MNTLHRFLVTGFLTGLALSYASTVLAEQVYQGQPYPAQGTLYQQQPQQRSYAQKIGRKALNGAINIPTAPLEVPKSMINNVNAASNDLGDGYIVYGIVGGVIEGGLQTAFRAAAGVVDLATFLIPTKPIVQPQYVWDDFYETRSSYGDVFRLDIDAYPQSPHFELPGQEPTTQRSGQNSDYGNGMQ
jgi:putative exosortase-associated protein (TIGR04073 family)